MINKHIKAVLLDSGRVLNYPKIGHWFITNNFFKYVDLEKYKKIDKNKINNGFSKAQEYIIKQDFIKTEHDEYNHFYEFYRIFSNELKELNLTVSAIEALAKDLVYNYEKYTFFEDAKEVIPKLSENYKLAIVSDAWPSLENVFVHAGLRKYFSSFIISSKLGVTKPNELMYKSAINELNFEAEQCIFIDDNINNCDGAKKLGIESLLLCRDKKSYVYNKVTCKRHKVIKSLFDL
ncbi:HAD-IA family hydrolase [Clostridium sp. C8-1-8]|uniref:HAD-IA family hydrolase n=1 Tax=Clostridium sp. C8-1-8 TaxID=2698831 RepID=UPI0013681B5F|nr:HAD-IA family hydrolase [Clostridium sp. C8-1-8]